MPKRSKNKDTEFEFVCICCGKHFKTTDPVQELCRDCLCDLADFLTVPKKSND